MISKYSVKRPFTVLVGVILVIVLGVVSLTKMTTDLLPNMSFPYALIITTDVGASPEEVESDVTAPIEAAMATTSNIKEVRSMSYNSYSVVICEYAQSANMDSIMIEIQQKLDQLEGNWDDLVGTPMIMQIDPDMLPIMMAAVDVKGLNEFELSDYVDNTLIPQLESTSGVASVTATGTVTETIRVTLNQKKIDELNDKVQASILAQFEEAEKQIDDGKSQVESGQKALNDASSTLTDTINNTLKSRETLYNTEADLTKQKAELNEQRASLQTIVDSINAFIASESYTKLKELDEGIPQLEEGIKQSQNYGIDTTEMEAQLEAAKAGLSQGNKAIKDSFSGLEALGVTVNEYKDLPAALKVVNSMLAQLDTGIATIDTGLKQIEEGKISMADGLDVLNANASLAALQVGSNSATLATTAASLEDASADLKEARESALEQADMNSVLSLDTISNLLVAQNFDMPAGYASEEKKSYLVRVGEKVESVEDLKSLILMDMGMDEVKTIRLSDVADVEVISDSGNTYAVVNGNPAVMLSMEKQTGFSTGSVTDTLLDRFKVLEKENENLSFTVLMNQGVYIDMIVKNVMQNMILGAILAIFVLWIFMKDFKPTLVIACSIPLSVITAITLMYFTGVTLNTISMSGLALGIGMLVDNSIVVIENIYRLRNEGYSVKKAAVEGAGQVSGAIIASTLTTVSVFAPIIFTEGITRQLFVDMGFTILFTLGASLLVALTFVPAMSSAIMKRTKEIKHPWFERFQEWYGSALRVCLRFKPVVFILAIVLLVGSIYASLSRGFTFMDMAMESDEMSITIEANEDDKLEFDELVKASEDVTDLISDIDGIKTIGSSVGRNSTMSLMQNGANKASMYVILEKAELASQVAKEINKRIEGITDYTVSLQTSNMDMTSMMASGITVEIKGSDLETLQELAKQVGEIVETTEGTTHMKDGLDNLTPEYVITVDKKKAAEYKMTVAQVYQMVAAKMAAKSSSTKISTDLKDYEVFVQTEEQKDTTLSDIRKITFTHTNEDGEEEELPLETVCSFEEKETLSTINRSSQVRYINVSCAIDEKHNVTLVSDKIKSEIKKMDIPEGYSISMTGEDETIAEAMGQMLLMLLLAVIFIYLIMVAQFQSLLSPFIIMFTIPLAFTGGFFALFFAGEEVSVIAMLGFVMLAGIIVNNGIVLIDYINQARRQGVSKKDAIVEAGKTRIRPILMTALTTILAMSTMALGFGSGSEMGQPMAITMIGGLVYGTVLTLVVVPCIYDAFNKEKDMTEEEL